MQPGSVFQQAHPCTNSTFSARPNVWAGGGQRGVTEFEDLWTHCSIPRAITLTALSNRFCKTVSDMVRGTRVTDFSYSAATCLSTTDLALPWPILPVLEHTQAICMSTCKNSNGTDNTSKKAPKPQICCYLSRQLIPHIHIWFPLSHFGPTGEKLTLRRDVDLVASSFCGASFSVARMSQNRWVGSILYPVLRSLAASCMYAA